MKKIFLFLCALYCINASAQLKFHWRQISGPSPVTIVDPDKDTTLATGLMLPGDYQFEFSVSNKCCTSYDTCMVTVIYNGGSLGIDKDTVYQITRPKITKLEINS